MSTRKTVSFGEWLNKSDDSMTSPNFSPIFFARSSKIFSLGTAEADVDPWLASDRVSSRGEEGSCVLEAAASRLSDLNAFFTLEITLPTPLPSTSCPGIEVVPVPG